MDRTNDPPGNTTPLQKKTFLDPLVAFIATIIQFFLNTNLIGDPAGRLAIAGGVGANSGHNGSIRPPMAARDSALLHFDSNTRADGDPPTGSRRGAGHFGGGGSFGR